MTQQKHPTVRKPLTWPRVVVVALLMMSGLVIATTPAQAAMPAFQMPFPCGEVWHASTYTSAPPFNPHHAIDWNSYPEDAGRTVVASAAGTATPFYHQYGGHQVRIDHGDGWKTVYAHLQEGGRASGQVIMGQTIGFVGNSGSSGTSAPLAYHLHWEQWHNNVLQTPLYADGAELSPGTTTNPRAYTSNNCSSPPPDVDKDGVPDSADRCPNQWGLPALNGCPDSDNDGTPDYSDECQNIPGLVHQQGCRQPMATYQGDYNGDGKKDVAAFYAYPERGNAMGLFVWDGNGNGTFAAPRQPWYTASGWEWRRVIPAGAGDYNGDGRADLSVLYRYDSGVVRVITLYAASNGTFNAVFSPEQTGMEGFNLTPAGVGDYNGDGRPDIASFYRYPERGNALGLLVWSGNSDGTFGYAQVKWYTATGWEGHRLIPAGVGTFDTDNRTDISAFYRYDGNVVRMWTWRANSDGTFSEPTVRFDTSGGWNGSHLIPMGAGDYNGDGNQDIASFYGYPELGNALGVFVWYGNGDGTFSSPSQVWYTVSGWEWLRVIPASVGDFNADGRTDLSMFYRYDGNVVRMFTWLATPTAFQHPTETFYSGGGWNGNHLLT